MGSQGFMLAHVVPSGGRVRQFGSMKGHAGIITGHLGSSLGLWGEKVVLAQARLTFSKATVALNWEQFWIWGVREVLP